MIIVTSYDCPDIDGVACIIGYSELLNELGQKAKGVYYGDLRLEVEFVQKYTEYFPVEKHSGEYLASDTFVIVDTADPMELEKSIPLDQVREIFDHRKMTYADKFPKAKIKVELVGSCATLITEEFRKHNLYPKQLTALYLYSAIVSNTVNFKNGLTTERDIKAGEWLKNISKPSNSYVEEMFEYKSKVNKENLSEVIEQDLAIKEFGGKRIGIGQIEVANLNNKINELDDEIGKILIKIQEREKLDYVFFSGIDIVKGFNIFISVDPKSRDLLGKILEIKPTDDLMQTDTIIMRKQIWAKIAEISS